jgi:hypothetical protein
VYTIFSFLIDQLGKSYSLLPPKVILWFFIVSDIIATATQITGAALIGVSQSRRKDPSTANHILLGGLAYQVFSMSTFVVITGLFLYSARQSLRGKGLVVFAASLVIATVLIYARRIFRLIETSEGLMVT